jgi:hypothetical protein
LGNVLAAAAEGVVIRHVPAAGMLPEEVREFEKLSDHVAICGLRGSGKWERMISRNTSVVEP